MSKILFTKPIIPRSLKHNPFFPLVLNNHSIQIILFAIICIYALLIADVYFWITSLSIMVFYQLESMYLIYYTGGRGPSRPDIRHVRRYRCTLWMLQTGCQHNHRSRYKRILFPHGRCSAEDFLVRPRSHKDECNEFVWLRDTLSYRKKPS